MNMFCLSLFISYKCYFLNMRSRPVGTAAKLCYFNLISKMLWNEKNCILSHRTDDCQIEPTNVFFRTTLTTTPIEFTAFKSHNHTHPLFHLLPHPLLPLVLQPKLLLIANEVILYLHSHTKNWKSHWLWAIYKKKEKPPSVIIYLIRLFYKYPIT